MKTKKENSEEKPKKDKFLPEEILNSSKQMTRRSFISAFGRVVGLGIVVSKVAVFAASTPQDPNAPCLSGLPAEDLCTTKENDTCISGSIHTDECIKGGDSDRCPGNAAPHDSCPETGVKIEDNCSTNREPEDICPPPGANEADNCETGQPTEDVCPFPGDEKNDRCYTGLKSDDICGTPPYRFPENGGLGSDECPGGGESLNGEEVDICKPEYSEGDICPPGTWGNEDDCKESSPDDCIAILNPFDDDTCITGTDGDLRTNGTLDYCTGGKMGSDQCNDGSSKQDKCIGASEEYGITDVCPGGASSLDECFYKNETEKSEDYCNTSLPFNDVCDSKNKNDEDLCPSGKSGDDSCDPKILGEDICFAFNLIEDQCPHKNNDPNDMCPNGGPYIFSVQDRCNPGYGIIDTPE